MYSKLQQASPLCTVALTLNPQNRKFNGWNEKGLASTLVVKGNV